MFRDLIEEALNYVNEIDPKDAQVEDLNKYVQKQFLRADDYDSFVILEGITTNKSKVHFGNTTQGIHSIIKKAHVGNAEIPILSDNAFRGMLNHQLRVLSKRLKLGEETCGVFDEKGQKKYECGQCFKCGIMGFLRPVPREEGVSPNAVHRLMIRTFLPVGETEIVREFHNSIDAAKGTIYYTAEKERFEKAATMFVMDYIRPECHFPLQLTMRGMNPAEIGVSLMSARLAWNVLGLGRHKNGSFTTWEDNNGWELRYIEIDKEEEVYRGDKLNELLDTLKRIGYKALEKNLFRNYELAHIKRVKVEKTEKKKKGAKVKQNVS